MTLTRDPDPELDNLDFVTSYFERTRMMIRLQMEVRSTSAGITYPNSGLTKWSGPKKELALTT